MCSKHMFHAAHGITIMSQRVDMERQLRFARLTIMSQRMGMERLILFCTFFHFKSEDGHGKTSIVCTFKPLWVRGWRKTNVCTFFHYESEDGHGKTPILLLAPFLALISYNPSSIFSSQQYISDKMRCVFILSHPTGPLYPPHPILVSIRAPILVSIMTILYKSWFAM